MSTLRGIYIPCGYWNGSQIQGSVLFKEVGGSSFSEVHRNSALTGPTASSGVGFTKVHGTLDSKFLVAVGMEPWKHNQGYRVPAVMSYAFDGVWTDVAGIDSTWRFVHCYVPESGVAYVSGFIDSGLGWKTGRIWRWTPAGGFVEVHNYYYNGGWPVFHWLSGVGANLILGGLHFTGPAVYDPARELTFDGVTWTTWPYNANCKYPLPWVINDSLAWANDLRNWSGDPSYLCKWDGNSWTRIHTHNAAGSDLNHTCCGTEDDFLAGHSDSTYGNSIWKHVAGTSTKTKVLDLGGAYGTGLDISRANGLDVIAVRHSATTVSYAESSDGGDSWGSWVAIADNFRTGREPFFGDLEDPPFATIAEDGGYELELEGTFPAGAELEVYIGPNADEDTDEPCYGGEGYGYNPVSEDGTTLTVITPQLGVGDQKVSWRQVGGGNTAELGKITVVERNWPHRQFGHKANFPPWTDLGPSRLDSETLRDEEVEPPTPTAPATWGAGGRWGISTWNTAP